METKTPENVQLLLGKLRENYIVWETLKDPSTEESVELEVTLSAVVVDFVLGSCAHMTRCLRKYFILGSIFWKVAQDDKRQNTSKCKNIEDTQGALLLILVCLCLDVLL